MSEQLSLFEDKKVINNGRLIDSYEINWRNIIGSDKDMADIRGYGDLTDKAQEMLKYLYINHLKPEDGFIPAKKLAGVLKFWDTRELRYCGEEIDKKTDLVVYSSQNGYKLASNDDEIEQACKFALAPALTTIKRVAAKSKNKSYAKMLQGFVGNCEKEFGGNAQGQLQADDDMELTVVNHFPKREDVDYMPSIDDRIEFYKNKGESKNG